MFFEEYFSKRGEALDKPSPRGEVQVKCPFPHDKGMEEHASASVNVKHRIYKCFACTAEDRESGMSETSFISKVYNTSYDNASLLKGMQMGGSIDNLKQLTDNLLGNSVLKDFLNNRGITDDAIVEYKLGYAGEGIVYPVILDNILFDSRTYDPDGDPKIRSKKGAKPLLFPYDQWVNDTRPTLLCAGENDTILARLKGFNAVETTLGEGSVPIIVNVFYRKKVYIAYDCDKAGRSSTLRMAFFLKEAGADVYLVDLGLTGTKDDKDITDYFMKHNKTTEDLQSLLDSAPMFTQEQYIEQKNKEYELVELWNVKQSRYSDKYISSRVIQSGHFELPLVDVPSTMEWQCLGARESNVCNSCPFHVMNSSGAWTLDSDNLGDVLKLVEVNEAEQRKVMRRLCHIPDKCPNSRISVTSKKHVEKVTIAPDVETESEASGFKITELHAYIIGTDTENDTEDGNRYRIYFKRYAHPKDQSLILVIDKVEDSDNAINSFKVTQEFIQAMKMWQGNPYIVMKKRFEELGKKAVGKYLPESIFYASELIYHGILDFKFMGDYMKGHPEGLIVGASRTGKSEVGNVMSVFYGLGNVTECKNATAVGLIGGVDKSSNGTFRISWGSIPRNHKGMLFMDEISGLPADVFKQLTGLRSQRKAVIEKIRKGKAPAKTRLLWVGNPRVGDDKRSKSLHDYSTGVDVCLDLFPADEDISRFDFIVLVPEPVEYISPLNDDGTVSEKSQLPDELRQLIRWVWSRNKDQVIFEPYVERYIESVAHDLNKDFGSSVKIIGIEGVKKIARMATSIAACCFSSSSDGESVVVNKVHVDWVRDFLMSCYDNDIFRLKQFVQNERKFSVTNTEVNTLVAGFIKKYPMVIKLLLEMQQETPHYNLQNASGIAGDEYRFLTSSMYQQGLIKITSKGVSATRRLRLAVDEFKNNRPKKQELKDSEPKSFSDRINLN